MMKTFLEIGSCDFDTLNYLSDEGWQGAIVEPMEKYLNNIPRKPNVHYLNYAVDEKEGTRILYHANDDVVNYDRDYAGMSTFTQQEPIGFLTEEAIVNTITFERVLELTKFTEIDYLKIDVEGYDLILLRMFPFGIVKPKSIKIEYHHIGLELICEPLRQQGYHCENDGTDVYATLTALRGASSPLYNDLPQSP